MNLSYIIKCLGVLSVLITNAMVSAKANDTAALRGALEKVNAESGRMLEDLPATNDSSTQQITNAFKNAKGNITSVQDISLKQLQASTVLTPFQPEYMVAAKAVKANTKKKKTAAPTFVTAGKNGYAQHADSVFICPSVGTVWVDDYTRALSVQAQKKYLANGGAATIVYNGASHQIEILVVWMQNPMLVSDRQNSIASTKVAWHLTYVPAQKTTKGLRT
jgi:hypothetical protein